MNILCRICIFSLFHFLTVCRKDSKVMIEKVVAATGLTEGPHWQQSEQKLLFVDIHGNKICRYDPVDSKVFCVYIANGPVGVAVPVENIPNTFVVGSGPDILLVTWDGKGSSTNPPIRKLKTAEIFSSGTRFNDGKADSSGRFWAGTMTEINRDAQANQGALYSLDEDLVFSTQIEPVTISNGLAWNPDDDIFYYIDSSTKQVVAYDYDSYHGTIENKRVIFDLQKNNLSGVPDGMTIDSDGNLWVALFDGAQIIQVNPRSGEMIRSIPMPAKKVTSLAFGGPLLDILFCTTAGYEYAGTLEKAPADDLQGGSIFAIRGIGVRGLPSNSFKLND